MEVELKMQTELHCARPTDTHNGWQDVIQQRVGEWTVLVDSRKSDLSFDLLHSAAASCLQQCRAASDPFRGFGAIYDER